MEIAEQILSTTKALPFPRLIGVSGFGGSGKSTFARALGAALGSPMIGIDSFQKDGAFDTKYECWGIMDFARLEQEVLRPFSNKEKLIRYGHFEVPAKAISKTIQVTNAGQLIVEGVGLFRSNLTPYFTYKIWIDCPLETAILRGKKRDREEYQKPADECWDGIWKKNDLQYIEAFKPKSVADLIVSNVDTPITGG